ncbi:MAG: 4'-phosphopantetheinyl transferase superfamily protein [Oscillospiraceae bacterium]|nr:4'-phosphopantetheinyl transferase superfamily protein [Oscillospiraceae bacterium]
MTIYISGIKDFTGLQGVELVPAARRTRIARYARPADKARCLVSGLMLRRICGVTRDNQILLGENGKPYLATCETKFSLSHSGEFVILAVSDRELGADPEKAVGAGIARPQIHELGTDAERAVGAGIARPQIHELGADIEQIKPYKQSTAARCFTPNELEWLQNQSSNAAFFYLWTAKESVMKAVGKGFALPPQSFSVNPETPQSPVIAAEKSWYLHHMEYKNHVICTASEVVTPAPKLVLLTPHELLR